MNTPRRFVSLAAAAIVACALVACESAVTMENYQQIQKGMTLSEVESIMGGSGEDQTMGGAGIGATGIEGQAATESVHVWSDGDKQIIVTFRDGKVHQSRPVNLE